MEDLLRAASGARENAYAPYSGFRVGASIRTDDNRIFSGCNVENAAYPQGICAEGAAITAMVSAGARDIREVLIIGSGPEICSPCGGCRQKINEFADADTVIHMCNEEGDMKSVTLAELMPFAFGPNNLEAAE